MRSWILQEALQLEVIVDKLKLIEHQVRERGTSRTTVNPPDGLFLNSNLASEPYRQSRRA